MTSVTVVICSYNHLEYLEQALDSVVRQTVQPAQLIITDDASTDGSPDRIQKWIDGNWPTAEFIRNERNHGLPATLNLVRSRLRSDCTLIMAADDWMVDDRIERQVAALEAGGPKVGMVYGDMTEVDGEGRATGQRWFDLDRMGPARSGDLFLEMVGRAFISAPTVMVRTELLLAAGPYDETLVAEDYDMFLRLSRSAEWVYLDDPLVNYRVLASSLSRSDEFKARQRVGRIGMLRKHVGATPEADRVIARRTAQMAVSLYHEGRSPAATAADLRFVLGVERSPRTVLYWGLATSRIPGSVLVRGSRFLGRAHPAGAPATGS
jgi:glycosyltransferase involved in cell wall biosynthesis